MAQLNQQVRDEVALKLRVEPDVLDKQVISIVQGRLEFFATARNPEQVAMAAALVAMDALLFAARQKAGDFVKTV